MEQFPKTAALCAVDAALPVGNASEQAEADAAI
jgi:hypothetical protein